MWDPPECCGRIVGFQIPQACPPQPIGDGLMELGGGRAGIDDGQPGGRADARKLGEHRGVGVVDIRPCDEPTVQRIHSVDCRAEFTEVFTVCQHIAFGQRTQFAEDLFLAREVLIHGRTRGAGRPRDGVK